MRTTKDPAYPIRELISSQPIDTTADTTQRATPRNSGQPPAKISA
jgi:hypothetical protein